MNKKVLLPNRPIRPEEQEKYFARGLARILGSKTFIASLPLLQSVGQAMTPMLTIPQIRKRLEEAGVSTPETSLEDVRILLSQPKYDSGRWPMYRWDEFKDTKTSHTLYRFTPYSLYE